MATETKSPNLLDQVVLKKIRASILEASANLERIHTEYATTGNAGLLPSMQALSRAIGSLLRSCAQVEGLAVNMAAREIELVGPLALN